MIEFLRGTLLSIDDDHVVVDAHGVGYGLDCPASTLERLPAVGGEAAIHVVLIPSDDSLRLYGFATREERVVFEIFRGVSGIGPRVALDVLSTLPIPEFVAAIRTGNIATLTRIPGIGRKRAERLIVELKDRLDKFPAGLVAASGFAPSAVSESDGYSGGASPLFDDAVAALEALGMKSASASRAVAAALRTFEDETPTVQNLVKRALQTGR
jgi:Holliday junction DNA helicase RuvA